MSTNKPGHFYPDIRPDFGRALINFGMKKNGRPMHQKDFDPTFSASHINNVASGRSSNQRLRDRLEEFIEKHGNQ